MIPEYETNVNVRVPLKQEEEIKKLVESGKLKSLSQVVREALKEFLSKQLGEAKPSWKLFTIMRSSRKRLI